MRSRILLVEDNASDIELIHTACDEAGIDAEFTIFRDGESAISGVRALANSGRDWRPDLILLDLNLPRASGHDVLKAIRSLEALSNLTVLILSTSNYPLDRSRCLEAGASEYLVKPQSYADLLAIVIRIRERWLPK